MTIRGALVVSGPHTVEAAERLGIIGARHARPGAAQAARARLVPERTTDSIPKEHLP